MKLSSIFIIIAIGIGAWLAGTGRKIDSFEKIESIKAASVISFEKIRKIPVIGAVFSKKNINDIRNTTASATDYVKQTRWVQWCEEEPIMSGMLLMVGGIGVCLFGFIVHLIRTDARF